MKKLVLSVSVLFAAISGLNAQLADGTPAPNFTATDLNGVSHTLTDYLNAGKTVIIDISATWCPPCWSYHNSHALSDIYNAYGPNGSNEVMVFYVEGDNATNIADLNGTGTNTQGDWVTGTPYPIINSATIADDYAITYFPTIYRICPDGLVYEIGSLTASAIKTNINTNCGTLAGVQNHAGMEDEELALCSTSGQPQFSIKNYGPNAITNAVAILKENGAQVATANYSGSLAQFATGTVTFPSMTINTTSNYTAELSTINGAAPHNASLTQAAMDVVSAELSSTAITVKIFTDNYPSEISWKLKNSAGAVVATGGPYQPGTDDQFGGGGPDANTTKTQNVTLPAGTDCYSFEFLDSYGDGWSLGSTVHGAEILSNGNSVYYQEVENFGSSLVRDAALRTDATSGINELESNSFVIYPNPASDILNVTFEASNADYTVALVDLQGRVMTTANYSALNGSQTIEVPVAAYAKGSYIVTVTSNGVSTSKNVVIK
jgi:hypothetical protein